MSTAHDDRIRARAFAIWEAKGRPVGRDMEHWVQAEREIMKEQAPATQGLAAARPDVAGPKAAKAPKKRSPSNGAPEGMGAGTPGRTPRRKKEVL